MSAETEKLIARAKNDADALRRLGVNTLSPAERELLMNDFLALADALAAAEARADELQADYDHLVSQTEPTRRAQEEASRRAFAAEARAVEHESAAIEFCAAADAAEARADEAERHLVENIAAAAWLAQKARDAEAREQRLRYRLEYAEGVLSSDPFDDTQRAFAVALLRDALAANAEATP